MARFIRALNASLGGPLTVIRDRISIHECQSVKDYLDEAIDVFAEPLPPYAPELDPTDGIWRQIKYQRLPKISAPVRGRPLGRRPPTPKGAG
jgi:hypothetical protein